MIAKWLPEKGYAVLSPDPEKVLKPALLELVAGALYEAHVHRRQLEGERACELRMRMWDYGRSWGVAVMLDDKILCVVQQEWQRPA